MPRSGSKASMADSASARSCRKRSRRSPRKSDMIRSLRSVKRCFFSSASICSPIFDSQSSTSSSEETTFFRSRSSFTERRPVWLMKMARSCFCTASTTLRMASALRLTISSRPETRSSRCSSSETSPSSSYSSASSSSNELTPERTRSFAWQRKQYSRSSSFNALQVWQSMWPIRTPWTPCVIPETSGLPIVVEPASALSAQPSGIDHLHQERTWPVFWIAEPFFEHAKNGQADIEPDEVGEHERSHRMVHAELHHAVDRFRRGHALEQREDRFVDHGHQHTVGDESWVVVDLDGRFPHPRRQLGDARIGLVAGGNAADDFDERHDRHRVHEVHTDHFVGAPGRRGDLRDGDRRRVRGQDAIRTGQRVEVCEELRLRAEILDDGLDHDIGVCRGRNVTGRPDPPEDLLLILSGHLPFVDAALQVRGDRRHAALEEGFGDVDEGDVEAGRRGGVGNAVAHGAGADHDDLSHGTPPDGGEAYHVAAAREAGVRSSVQWLPSASCAVRRSTGGSSARSAISRENRR